MNGFAARNMEEMVNESFARVQAFSSDWHADTFAGSTVRKVSRGMWGYDSVSDVLLLMLGPAVIVLFGLSLSMLARAPLAGLAELALVSVYMVVNIVMTTRWVRAGEPQVQRARQPHRRGAGRRLQRQRRREELRGGGPRAGALRAAPWPPGARRRPPPGTASPTSARP